MYRLELEFEGISGSFVGNKGRPGVEYNTELGVYKAEVLNNNFQKFVNWAIF